jgi:lambda family phage portal protein
MREQLKLFAQSGYPYYDTAYSGASTQRKELAPWQPLMQPADAELLPELDTLVARSRDLGRNHGIAASAFQVLVDNILGTGLRLAAQPDYRALGRDIEWAGEWTRTVESLWRAYSESMYFDAACKESFAGMTELVLRSSFISGEVFALPLWMERPGQTFATTFQLIEGDRISNPNGSPDTESLRGGIQIDSYGKPLAYYVHKASEGDYWIVPGMYFMGGSWERIAAESAPGRKGMLHIYKADRTNQSRGKPVLSSVLEQFKMFDHYQRSELQSAIVNALVAGFIETPVDQAAIADMMGGDPNSYLARKNEWKTQLRGGAMIPLYPGDKLSPFAPSRPSTQYTPYVETTLRHIAAGLNMPYELLIKDFSKTNYSSARAALLEAWRYFNYRRKWIADVWATQVYSLWFEEAVSKGLIDAPNFYDDRSYYTRCRWIGAGRGWIDPVKEAQAAVIRMNSGISTLEIECAEQGLDYEEVMEQKAREYMRMQELGIFEYIVTQPPGHNAPQKATGSAQASGAVTDQQKGVGQ